MVQRCEVMGRSARIGTFGTSLVASIVAVVALTGCGSGKSSTAKPPATSAATTTTEPNRNGPFAVGRRTETFVDSSRKTSRNGNIAEKPTRTLETIIEYPAQGTPDPNHEVAGAAPVSGRFPIVAYVHGFGAHADNPYLHPWAAAGFVAVAPKFPLTNTDTPGGPNLSDIANEPADVSFVLSQMLRLPTRDADLQRIIDPSSIGVMGASAGASVAFEVSYAPGTRFNGIKAAIEQSGGCPRCPPDTYPVGVSVPLMLMHGTADPAAPYQWSANEFVAARSPKYFVTLAGAKHIQYDEPWLSISVRASIDFFDRSLKSQDAALSRLATDANVPGRARLQQG
jgi:fermentation-respiration switch protein FrsA (DUF1100 family)